MICRNSLLVSMLVVFSFLLRSQEAPLEFLGNKSVQFQFPYLKWGTFFGSNVWLDFTYADAAAADEQGNAYFAGYTEFFSDLPTPGCFQYVHGGGGDDGFIQKFDPDGNRLWGTYYGGNQPDYVYDIAVDHDGFLILGGLTGSPEGIATEGTYQTTINNQGDGFIAKFDAEGNRLWGTYLGGNGNDWIAGVGVDSENNIIVCGNTRSTAQFATPGSHQPLFGGSQFGDGFLAKFTPEGQIVFCTYYGGAGYDESFNVCCDQQNFIYMTGTTNSDTAIGTPGTQQPGYSQAYTDGFLVKFDPYGNRIWGTYLGGDGGDDLAGVCLDEEKNIYVAGVGSSYNNIATEGAHKEEIEYVDGYLVKYNPGGQRIWGTYFGGPETEGLQTIRYSKINQQLIIGGSSNSAQGVAMPGAHQPNWYPGYSQQGNPWMDGMIAAFDTAGVQQWGTYIGGNMHDSLYDLDIDSLNNIVYCGKASSASSPYITTPGCFQASHTNQHASFFGMFAIDTLTAVPDSPAPSGRLRIRPNPFTDQICIEINPAHRVEDGVFSIFNLQGYSLAHGILQNGENNLNLGNLSTGIYILLINDGIHISTHKILKK